MIFILCAVVVLVCPVFAQHVKDGFKGYEWGTPIEKFDSSLGLILNRESDREKYYNVEIDSLAGVQLNECLFMFYDDEFAAVGILIKGLTDFDKLLRALNAAYGEAEQENPYIKKYVWASAKTIRTFEFNRFSEKGSLFMFSGKHITLREKDKQRDAEKAKEEF